VHGSNFLGSAIEVKQHCRNIGHADVAQQSSKGPIGALRWNATDSIIRCGPGGRNEFTGMLLTLS
jgi:hypothetical protein